MLTSAAGAASGLATGAAEVSAVAAGAASGLVTGAAGVSAAGAVAFSAAPLSASDSCAEPAEPEA